MNLNPFRKQPPQTESEPASAPAPAPVDPLKAAMMDEIIAADDVRLASAACKALDEEQKSWTGRRNAAQENFHKKIEAHLRAKDAVAKLSAPAADVVASGNVVPRSVGAVLGTGEN